MYYSKSRNSFYPGHLRPKYESSGTWPSDAAEITAEEHQALIDGQSQGKLIQADANGRPVLVDPPEPSIESIREGMKCTRRQGRLALLETGYLDQVETEIDGIEDPAQQTAARIEYEADTWERSNAFLQAMWAQLGGTPEELDDLFVLAATK